MERVSIVGGGNVGASTAFFVAENRTAPVTLVDVKEGLTQGKALDLMEAAPLRGYDTSIQGAAAIDAIGGSSVVVIAAGRARRPGESRVELFHDNAPVVRSICGSILQHAPGALVINLVEPVDLLTRLAQQTLGTDRCRVLGVGGLLTSTRLRWLASRELGVSPREVTAVVVGPHRSSMVFVRDTIRVSGLPIRLLLGEAKLEELIEEARGAGDAILGMARESTAYYGPGAAAAALIEAVVRDTHATLPVSMVCDGEYGVRELSVGVLAQVGKSGVERVVEAPLSALERDAFQRAAGELRQAWMQVCGKSGGA